MPDLKRRIGIDIGGTKIDALAFDATDKIIFEKRIDTPKSYGPMIKAVGILAQEAGAGSVGIGAPGSGHPETGLWRNSNFVASNGRPMARDLESVIGRPIRIENDANCFALSEAKDGAGAGLGVVRRCAVVGVEKNVGVENNHRCAGPSRASNNCSTLS